MALPASDWSSDISNVTEFTDPLHQVMIRMNGDPTAAWNIQSPTASTDIDAVVAGVIAVGSAAGTTDYLFDPENYDTTYLLDEFGQSSAGSPILNSPPLDRAAMCTQARAFGKAFGTSLWSRVPTATLDSFFGPTILLQFTDGGTGMPTSFADSAYADEPTYNTLPYFFLGLLDACPPTGQIVDHMEGGYYDFTGLDSLKRNMTASKEWVSIFFPSETPLIAKAATSWVPVPLIFVNP